MLKWTLSIVATQTLTLLHIYIYSVDYTLLQIPHCVTYPVHTGHQGVNAKPAILFLLNLPQKFYTDTIAITIFITDMMLHVTTGPSQSVPSPSSNHHPPPSTASPAISPSPGTFILWHHYYVCNEWIVT